MVETYLQQFVGVCKSRTLTALEGW